MYKTNIVNALYKSMKTTRSLSRYPKFMILPSSNVNIKFHCLQASRSKSHYTSLGLDQTASPKDIKSAYYELSLKFHPDKNLDSPESVQKFREIAEAYEVLGNPEKKRIYDSGINYETTGRPYDTSNDFGYRSKKPHYTGRDRYYNYEEHYKRHYEEFYKKQEAEAEEFRRRWQADRRYRHGEENPWERYQRQKEAYDELRMRRMVWSPASALLFSFWVLIGISILFPSSSFNPDNLADRKTVYYKVKKSEDKKSDTE